MICKNEKGKIISVWYAVEDSPYLCWLDGNVRMNGICPYCGEKGKHIPIREGK